jgi:hypothetical protein
MHAVTRTASNDDILKRSTYLLSPVALLFEHEKEEDHYTYIYQSNLVLFFTYSLVIIPPINQLISDTIKE